MVVVAAVGGWFWNSFTRTRFNEHQIEEYKVVLFDFFYDVFENDLISFDIVFIHRHGSNYNLVFIDEAYLYLNDWLLTNASNLRTDSNHILDFANDIPLELVSVEREYIEYLLNSE